MKFIKRAFGELNKFHMKWPRVTVLNVILSPLKLTYFNSKHYVVTDGVMTLRANNQILCNAWSYDFYDMTLATE